MYTQPAGLRGCFAAKKEKAKKAQNYNLPEEAQELSQSDSDPEEQDSPDKYVRVAKFTGVHSLMSRSSRRLTK